MPKAGIQFSKKDEWFTPKEVIDFFGPFDYDPATTDAIAKKNGIPNYDTIKTDGLKTDWSKFKKIWVNPPFTRKFEFLEKAVKTNNHIFFLMPIETVTTGKFHKIMDNYGGGILCGFLMVELNLMMDPENILLLHLVLLCWNYVVKEKGLNIGI